MLHHSALTGVFQQMLVEYPLCHYLRLRQSPLKNMWYDWFWFFFVMLSVKNIKRTKAAVLKLD